MIGLCAAPMAPPDVIKLGGEVISGSGLDALATDLARLGPLVVVHGGGKLASDLQRSLGQTPRVVHGRRVTDDGALEVIKMTVAGKMNVDLCAALLRAGARPVGLHGASSCAVRATRQPPTDTPEGLIDYGHVGEVVGVNDELLRLLLSAGFTPVLSCVGADHNGAVYNINADAVANRVALHLHARRLFLISDVPGILRDIKDPSSRIEKLSASQAEHAIRSGIVSGGMVPKVEESLAALRAGLSEVHVLGRLGAGDLARAAAAPGSVGTVLTK